MEVAPQIFTPCSATETRQTYRSIMSFDKVEHICMSSSYLQLQFKNLYTIMSCVFHKVRRARGRIQQLKCATRMLPDRNFEIRTFFSKKAEGTFFNIIHFQK